MNLAVIVALFFSTALMVVVAVATPDCPNRDFHDREMRSYKPIVTWLVWIHFAGLCGACYLLLAR